MGKGGGGSSTTQTSNIPEYARPYVMNMLGSAQNELFNTKPTYDESGKQTGTEITGMKGYKPFSTNAQDYFAPMSQGQNAAYNQAMDMRTPGQFGAATNLGGAAGYGALGTVNPAMNYGGMGAGYGQQGANIGLGALGYGGMGAGLGMQAAGAGNRYAQQATNPNDVAAYMSPYMQNVTDVQKAAAVRDYQKAMPALAAQQVKAGAFGGTRGAVERAEAQRGLMSQLQGIQAQGQQNAFQNAQQAQQFGANLGLQGLQAGMQGAGVGLQGIQGALAGTAQGMQGAQTGLQGVQGAQAGYNLAGQQATNLANIGAQQQQADISRIGLQNQLGQQQQAYQQQLINQQIQDYGTQQQYPLMQLANMSNLLRGLPMQSTTSQTYMPGPNVYSQLAGLGTAAYGLGRSGFFKEGGEVKGKLNYLTGGQVAMMTTDQLKEALKNPSLTPLEIDMVEKAIALRQRIEGNPESGNMMQRAGIGAIGTGNLVPEEVPAGAGGGIVAFAGTTGSQVKLPEDYEERRKRLSEKEQEMWDLLKDKGYFAKSEEAQNQMKQDIENARQRVPNDAIILGGLAAAAGNPDPYLRQNFFSNIAYGGMQGLGEYNRGLAQIAADKKQLLQQTTELDKSKYGRDVALANALTTQIGQLDNKQIGLLNAKSNAAVADSLKKAELERKASATLLAEIAKEKEFLRKKFKQEFNFDMDADQAEEQARSNVRSRIKGTPLEKILFSEEGGDLSVPPPVAPPPAPAPVAAADQKKGPFVVTAPNKKQYTFPTQEAADKFKKAAGIS